MIVNQIKVYTRGGSSNFRSCRLVGLAVLKLKTKKKKERKKGN